MTTYTCDLCGLEKSSKEFYSTRVKFLENGDIRTSYNASSYLRACFDCVHLHQQKRQKAKTTRYLNLPETTKSYLAGLIDGEGYIALIEKGKGPGYYDPRVTITSTSIKIMEWLQTTLEGLHFYKSRYSYTKSDELSPSRDTQRWKTRYTAVFTNTQALSLLTAITPYLVIKKEQAELVLSYVPLLLPSGGHVSPELKSERQELFLSIRQLNKKGVAPPTCGV
jgi:hypothetical protein